MWERLTLAARNAHWRTDAWARHNGWSEIPADVYAYVLLEDEECRATSLLRLAGVDSARFKKLATIPPSADPIPKEDPISISPAAEELVLRSYAIAIYELGSKMVGTEHILLALVEQKSWAESRLLSGINLRSYLGRL
jgi:ATP-dependent Clp protease ATP-binding subunit ClpA